mgnify:CR=1 FL=1
MAHCAIAQAHDGPREYHCIHCRGECDCEQVYCECGELISFNNEDPADHQQCAACEASGDADRRPDE